MDNLFYDDKIIDIVFWNLFGEQGGDIILMGNLVDWLVVNL